MKNILVALSVSVLIAFGLTALAAPPVNGPPNEPQQGQWPDGTRLIWQCDKGMEGKVRILVVAPNGAPYPAEIECLPPGQKKT